MDATYTDIILDLYKPNYVEVIAKQYDARTRVVRVTVTDQEKVVTLGSTISAKLAFTKPDGKGVLADCTISNNKVNAVLKEGMLAAAGLTVADIILVEGSQILSTMKFGLRIERAALQDSTVVSSNEYSSLETALLQVEEWNTYFEQTSGQIETKYTERLNGMIPKANIANSRAVTEAGFTLDARQANKTIPGTMGYDIEQLNSSLLTTSVPVGTDANTIAKNGTYHFASYASKYSNVPPDGANGLMFVMAYASRVFQIYGSTNFNRLYIRCTLGFGIDDSYWTTWKEL